MDSRRAGILDVDTGIDDSLAILYAGASPESERLGRTSLRGPGPTWEGGP